MSTERLKNITLISYVSLLLYMPAWLIYISPSDLSVGTVILLFVVPLLLPVKGLVQGNPYTYAWANFVLMIYFLHSLTTLWVLPADRIWASIELLLTSSMFLAGSYYAKYKGQELGLSIRRKKS